MSRSSSTDTIDPLALPEVAPIGTVSRSINEPVLFGKTPKEAETFRKSALLSPPETLIVDAQDHMYNPLKHRGIITATEEWSTIRHHYAKVDRATESKVTCSVLMDEDKVRFVNFDFPRTIFSHIPKINSSTYIIISSKEKPGSKRVDIVYRAFHELPLRLQKAFDGRINDEDLSELRKLFGQ